jgi:Flp pilus assembly pilin Flp
VNLQHFWKEEDGQDLVEYTLLLAMVCLASAALMIGSGGAVEGIWTLTSNNLSSARTAAS